MFDIMQQELDIKNQNSKKPVKRNGRIGILLGEFTRSKKDMKKLNKLSETLTLVFDKDIKLECVDHNSGITVDIIVESSGFRFMLLSIGSDIHGEDGDRNMKDFVDENNYSQEDIIIILTRLLYMLPDVKINGSFIDTREIPLSIKELEKYIEGGICYVDKEPYYQRLKLLKSY